MLALWYMLLGQFSVTFEYRPGSQHANIDSLSRQCGQCLRPDCPVGPLDLAVVETSSTSAMTDQPFTESAMGDSMDTDLLPEMSGETWVAAVHLDEATGDLTPPDSDPDFIASSLADKTLTVVWDWVRADTPPTWSECPRSSAHGVSSSEIYPWTRPVDFGVAALFSGLRFSPMRLQPGALQIFTAFPSMCSSPLNHGAMPTILALPIRDPHCRVLT